MEFSSSLLTREVSAARTSILTLLSDAIHDGYLEVEDIDQTFHFGNPKTASNVVHLKIISGKFWTRVFR